MQKAKAIPQITAEIASTCRKKLETEKNCNIAVALVAAINHAQGISGKNSDEI